MLRLMVSLISLFAIFVGAISCSTPEKQKFDEIRVALEVIEEKPEITPIASTQSQATPSSQPEEPISEKTPPPSEEKSPQPAIQEPSKQQQEEESQQEQQPAEKSEQEYDLVIAAGEEIPEKITNSVLVQEGEYQVVFPLEIAAGGKLRLAAGVKIELDQCGIFCQGELLAEGTEQKPISFSGEYGWDNITVLNNGKATLRHCKISRGSGVGVRWDPSGQFVLSRETGDFYIGGGLLFFNAASGVVENCEIFKCSGKDTLAVLYSEVTIANNKIYQNVEQGVFAFHGKGVIEGNEITEHGKAGILCAGESQLTISENQIAGNQLAGIMLRDTARATLKKNLVVNNQEGVRFEGTSQGQMIDNIVQKNVQIGISFSNSSAPVVTENIIAENGDVGIVTLGESAPVIKNNRISSHRKYNIWILENSTAQIEMNILQNSPVGIFFFAPTLAQIGKNAYQNCQQEVAKMARPK